MTCMKIAWVRDDGYPIGQKAPGKFHCKCGAKIPATLNKADGDVKCPACGSVFTWNGWRK